jgi:uncharacterized protein (UPF0147 family)
MIKKGNDNRSNTILKLTEGAPELIENDGVPRNIRRAKAI